MKLLLSLSLFFSLSVFASPRIITLDETNSINFNDEFTGQYVAEKQVEAMKLCDKEGKDIYISLYSPGGSVAAGELFIDTLNALPCNFHTISIFSASMSFITSQSLGQRLAIPSGVLMSHRASIGGVKGTIGGTFDSFMKLINTNIDEIDEKVAKRVGMSKEEYKKIIADDLWMTTEVAKKLNFIDETVLVKCDMDLVRESFTKTVRVLFGSFDVELSKCPLITSPVKVTARAGTPEELVEKFTQDYINIENRVYLSE